jgi:diacylglycerol kinase (ATP)
MRLTLIHNAKAGAALQPSLEALLALIRGAGHAVKCETGDGEDVERALEDPGDLVAVAGGDGTVGSVAARLVGRHIPIAVLPLGTANNISNTLGLGQTPHEHLIAGWSTARPTGFDSGLVHGPSGSKRFLEGVGVGLLGMAISQPDTRNEEDPPPPESRAERIGGCLNWIRERLWDYPAKQVEITLDGKDLSGEYILAEAMNIQYIGPSMHLAPNADPGDGQLELVLLSASDRGQLDEHIGARAEGRIHRPRWTVARGKRLQLGCDGSDVHVDDKGLPHGGSAGNKARLVLDVNVEGHAHLFLV